MKKPDDKLKELASRLQSACGDDLLSVVVYGSAARNDFHEQFSDVNVLIVLQRLPPPLLAKLSEVLRWWSRDEKLRPPLVMTLEELRESADVFAIELFDIKRSHQTLFGSDVVAEIDVPMNLHRVEVEHELRTTLLRLRHHYLLGSDNEDELRAVLAKSFTSVVTLIRHALLAAGHDVAHDKVHVVNKAGEVFGIEAQPLHAVLTLRNETRQPANLHPTAQKAVAAGAPDLHPTTPKAGAAGTPELRELYHAYMTAIQKVAHELDVQSPKRKLQKLS